MVIHLRMRTERNYSFRAGLVRSDRCAMEFRKNKPLRAVTFEIGATLKGTRVNSEERNNIVVPASTLACQGISFIRSTD